MKLPLLHMNPDVEAVREHDARIQAAFAEANAEVDHRPTVEDIDELARIREANEASDFVEPSPAHWAEEYAELLRRAVDRLPKLAPVDFRKPDDVF